MRMAHRGVPAGDFHLEITRPRSAVSRCVTPVLVRLHPKPEGGRQTLPGRAGVGRASCVSRLAPRPRRGRWRWILHVFSYWDNPSPSPGPAVRLRPGWGSAPRSLTGKPLGRLRFCCQPYMGMPQTRPSDWLPAPCICLSTNGWSGRAEGRGGGRDQRPLLYCRDRVMGARPL